MKALKSLLKFFVKMRVIQPLRFLFLSISAVPANKDNWENRLLIINLQALGDLVIFTGILKHYKKRFPGTRVYLLIKNGIGIESFLTPAFVDEVITLNYRKFTINPFYGFRFINQLRRIGFKKVINQDFSAAEIMGKIISVNLNADHLTGYEGISLEFRHPFDIQQKMNLKIVRENLLPRYTEVIPSLDPVVETPRRLPSAILHYARIYEKATGFKEEEYAPVLFSPLTENKVLTRFNLVSEQYVIFNVNASVPYKRWPLERCQVVAEYFAREGYSIVLVGLKKERVIAAKFEKMCRGFPVVNVAGETTLRELTILIEQSLLVFTNDTSLVHIAVAVKKPSLAITGGGQFGMSADYGYPNINRWVYQQTPCYGDNWQCARSLSMDEPAPCVASVSVESVLRAAHKLKEYLESKKYDTIKLPAQPFSSAFNENNFS